MGRRPVILAGWGVELMMSLPVRVSVAWPDICRPERGCHAEAPGHTCQAGQRSGQQDSQQHPISFPDQYSGWPGSLRCWGCNASGERGAVQRAEGKEGSRRGQTVLLRTRTPASKVQCRLLCSVKSAVKWSTSICTWQMSLPGELRRQGRMPMCRVVSSTRQTLHSQQQRTSAPVAGVPHCL